MAKYEVAFKKEVETNLGARGAVQAAWALMHGEPTRAGVSVWYSDNPDEPDEPLRVSNAVWMDISPDGFVSEFPRLTPRPYVYADRAYTQLEVANAASILVHTYWALGARWDSDKETRRRVYLAAQHAGPVDYHFAVSLANILGLFIDQDHDEWYGVHAPRRGARNWNVNEWLDWAYDIIEDGD